MAQRSDSDTIKLLREMVSIPSYSFQEDKRADFLCDQLSDLGFSFSRAKNNIIAGYIIDEKLPTLMLNSHIDTVKEVETYTFDPFHPPVSESTVFGLGSNDAGGSVVSMLCAFKHFYGMELPFNLMLVLSAEEERSGANGIDLLVEMINQHIDFAIIGEPTGMNAATAERGLIVIDAMAHGVSGHAARKEGINAIDIAIEDIQTLKQYDWMTVTQINAGSQHNVIPDLCSYVIDIRTSGGDSNQEIFDHLKSILHSDLKARSLTNKSSVTPSGCILLDALNECGIKQYVSPTTSDWMRIGVPAIKMGPGESARSHKADEFITVEEIHQGINTYIAYINKLSEIIKRGHVK